MADEDLMNQQALYDADTEGDLQAQPVQYDSSLSQVTYDENRGRAYEVPSALTGREIDLTIGTQLENRDKADYFGLLDLGADFAKNFARGAATDIISLPSDIIGPALVEQGETGGAGLAIPGFLTGFNMAARMQGKKSFVETDFDRGLVEVGTRIQQMNREFIEEMNLQETGETPVSKFAFDLGAGASNVLTSIGLLYATKRPEILFALFGARQKGQIFTEARAAGVAPLEASALSTIAGGVEGGIEALGGTVFLKAMSVNKVLTRTLLRTAEQAGEEFFQQSGEELITQLSGIRNDDLKTIGLRIGYAALLGGLLGFPAGGISSIAENLNVRRDLKSFGLTDGQVDAIIINVSEKTLQNGEVQAEVKRMLTDEIGSISATTEERKMGFMEIKKMFDEQAEAQKLERIKISDAALAQIQDTAVRGRVQQLVAEQNDILAEIDQLEKLKIQIEAETGVKQVADLQQKKVNKLQERMEQIEQELADAAKGEQTAKTKRDISELKKEGREVTKKLKEATAALEKVQALEDSNENKLAKKEIKIDNYFEDAFRQLQDEFDAKDQEIGNILVNNDVSARTAEDIKLKIKNIETLQRLMEREGERIKKSAARLARIAEKRRMTEMQKIIRQIKKANIQEITAEARIEIERLQKFLGNSKTLNDLRALNAQVQKIKAMGKEQLAKTKELREQQFNARKEALEKALEETKSRKKGPMTGMGEAENKAQSAIRFARANTLRAPRLLDLFDNFKDFKGAFSQIFYDTINRAFNKEVAMTSELTAKAINMMKDNKITDDEFQGKIEADGVTFTMSEAMHIYGAMKNPDDAVVLIYGNAPKWNVANPVQTIEKVITKLPNKFKDFADQLIDEMTSHYDRTRQAVLIETDGKRDLVRVEGTYIPRHRDLSGKQSFEEVLFEDSDSRTAYRKAFPGKKFTNPRVKIPNEFQSPIYLGLVETYFKHTAAREHYIAMSRVIKDLQRLVSDKDIREGINDKFGPEFHTELQNYVNRVAIPNNYRTHDQLEKTIRAIRERAAIVNLGWNLVTMAKQVPSFALAIGDTGFQDMGNAIAEVTRDFKAQWDFVKSRDPQMADRAIEREIDEIKANISGKAGKLNALRRRSFDGIKLFDRITVTVVWKAKYNQMLKMGASEQEAIEEAQKTVLRTQAASAPKDIAGLYSTNEFLNVFLQFTNELSQIYNIATHDIPGRVKLGRTNAAIQGGVGILLNSLLIFAAGHGRLPEDPEDLTDAIADTLVGAIPLVGGIINSARSGFDGMPAAIDLFVLKPLDAVKALAKGDTENAIKNGMYFSAGLFKIPFTQIWRSATGALDLAEGDTDDARRLVWSNWSLEN